MIRRPPKRIGGAIGLEFDALWEAVASAGIVSGAGVEIDRTTRGTVVRPRRDEPEVRVAFFALDQDSASAGESAQCRRVVSFSTIVGGAIGSGPTLADEAEDVLHMARPRTRNDAFLAVNVLVGVPDLDGDGQLVMVEEHRWVDAAYAPQFFPAP